MHTLYISHLSAHLSDALMREGSTQELPNFITVRVQRSVDFFAPFLRIQLYGTAHQICRVRWADKEGNENARMNPTTRKTAAQPQR